MRSAPPRHLLSLCRSDWNCLGGRSKAVPDLLDQLQAFPDAERESLSEYGAHGCVLPFSTLGRNVWPSLPDTLDEHPPELRTLNQSRLRPTAMFAVERISTAPPASA